jgi:hypothetical protein
MRWYEEEGDGCPTCVLRASLTAANALLRRALPCLAQWYIGEAIDDEQEADWRAHNTTVSKLHRDIRKHLGEVE